MPKTETVPQSCPVTPDDLSVSTPMDRAARKLGRAIYRFRRLPTGGKAVVVTVLVLAVILAVKACNAVTAPDPMSFRAGKGYGYQMGLVYTGMGGPTPSEADIEIPCIGGAGIAAANGYGWIEGGMSYDIIGSDVDKPSFTEGCVEGFKAARRGEPAP